MYVYIYIYRDLCVCIFKAIGTLKRCVAKRRQECPRVLVLPGLVLGPAEAELSGPSAATLRGKLPRPVRNKVRLAPRWPRWGGGGAASVFSQQFG